MPLSTAAKAALCICPPAAMVGTVATVPAAKRAVHHLTAPHHARPVHRVATAAVKPAGEVRRADCYPVAPGPLPAAPIVTYAAPIPDEPAGAGPTTGTGTGLSPAAAVYAAQAAVPVGPVVNNPGTGVTAPPVPEPATWALIIVGAGAVGVVLRRRRGGAVASGRSGRIAAGGTMWSVGAAAEAGDAAATSAVAAKSTLAGVAGKAMLCACPAAIVAGSAVGVPPVRHAVYAATAPVIRPAAAPPVSMAGPCDPATAVPVSAASVTGYPDTVATVPTPAA